MLTIVLTMLLVVLVSAAVVAYVAFPHRGEAMPGIPWLGRAMRRGVDRLPTVAEEDNDHVASGSSGAHASR